MRLFDWWLLAEVLQKWPLFGSSFFAVRRVSDPAERSEHILALNKNGVHFLDVMTHVRICVPIAMNICHRI